MGIVVCNQRYNLKAVVEHRGIEINRGHYTATLLCNNRWVCVDDHHIINNSVEPRHGFVFIYEKSSSGTGPQGTLSNSGPGSSGLQGVRKVTPSGPGPQGTTKGIGSYKIPKKVQSRDQGVSITQPSKKLITVKGKGNGAKSGITTKSTDQGNKANNVEEKDK